MIRTVLRRATHAGVAVPDLPSPPEAYSTHPMVYVLAVAAVLALIRVGVVISGTLHRSRAGRPNTEHLIAFSLCAIVAVSGGWTLVHVGEGYSSQAWADYDRLVERASARAIADLESSYGVDLDGVQDVPLRIGEASPVAVLFDDGGTGVCDLVARVDGYALECGQR